MSAVEKFISQVKERRVQVAMEGLSRVENGTSFDFGRLAGIIIGLKMAEELLEEILGADDDQGKRKKL